MKFGIKFGMKSGQDFNVMIDIQTRCDAMVEGDMEDGWEPRMLALISAKDHHWENSSGRLLFAARDSEVFKQENGRIGRIWAWVTWFWGG